MCLIAFKPQGATLDSSLLRCASQMNQDGAGIVYRAGSVFKSERTVGQYDPLIGRANDPGTESWLHFRFATAGDTTIRNCHPFEVARLSSNHAKNPTPGKCYRVWLMHNGCIPNLGSADMSDTAVLAKIAGLMCRDNPRIAVECPRYAEALESLCEGSRVVLVDSRGIHRLLHRKTWVEREGGILLSNGYHDSWTAYGDPSVDSRAIEPYEPCGTYTDDGYFAPFVLTDRANLPHPDELRKNGIPISRFIARCGKDMYWVVMDSGARCVTDAQLDDLMEEYWRVL